jgi:hypothetical protein
MRHILHILTKPADDLAADVIRRQRRQANDAIEVFDLTREQPDYAALLERVFAADSVLTW